MKQLVFIILGLSTMLLSCRTSSSGLESQEREIETFELVADIIDGSQYTSPLWSVGKLTYETYSSEQNDCVQKTFLFNANQKKSQTIPMTLSSDCLRDDIPGHEIKIELFCQRDSSKVCYTAKTEILEYKKVAKGRIIAISTTNFKKSSSELEDIHAAVSFYTRKSFRELSIRDFIKEDCIRDISYVGENFKYPLAYMFDVALYKECQQPFKCPYGLDCGMGEDKNSPVLECELSPTNNRKRFIVRNIDLNRASPLDSTFMSGSFYIDSCDPLHIIESRKFFF